MKKWILSPTASQVLAAICALALLICAGSLLLPGLRRQSRVAPLGDDAILAGESVALALGYFAGDQLEDTAARMSAAGSYAELCDYLGRVQRTGGYQAVYLLVGDGDGGYLYLADGAYRSSGAAGIDYHAIGEAFPLAEYGKESRKILGQTLAGEAMRGYTRAPILADGATDGTLLAAVPVYTGTQQLAAILCLELPVAGARFYLLFGLDLRVAAAVSGGVLLLGAAAWGYLHSLRKREALRAAFAAENARRAQDAAPPPDTREEDPDETH